MNGIERTYHAAIAVFYRALARRRLQAADRWNARADWHERQAKGEVRT